MSIVTSSKFCIIIPVPEDTPLYVRTLLFASYFFTQFTLNTNIEPMSVIAQEKAKVQPANFIVSKSLLHC